MTSTEQRPQPIFETYAWGHGFSQKLSHDGNPFELSTWQNGRLSLNNEATHYGIVGQGEATLQTEVGEFRLKQGMYFSVPGESKIGGEGSGLVISQEGFRGVFLLGGPVEQQGRLRYIDGCSDSLLIPPLIKGDACLNLLHIPAGVCQSTHTHPSFRLGLVLSGSGECCTPTGNTPLLPGLLFTIHPHGLHHFQTHDQTLTIIAFHPDSDFGPTHEDHPMLNRTYLQADQ